jgi:hypothetical protein
MNMQFITTQNKHLNNNITMMRINSFARNIQPTQITQPEPTKPSENKMTWGEPTWFLLHTLAEKAKDSYFNQIRIDLLNTIYSICSNLPCPMCAEHAIDYLKTSNFFKIATKNDLKIFLCIFHNVVNQKKNFPLFDINSLNDKYSAAATKPIIYNFMHHFQKRSKNLKMLANDMYRQRVINGIKQWFSTNIIYFDE